MHMIITQPSNSIPRYPRETQDHIKNESTNAHSNLVIRAQDGK